MQLQSLPKISIRTKLMLGFVGLTLALVCGQLIFNVFYFTDYYYSIKQNSIQAVYTQISAQYDGVYDTLETIALPFEDKDGMNIMVFDANGLLYVSQRSAPTSQLPVSESMRNLMNVEHYTVNPEVDTIIEGADNRKMLRLGGVFSYEGEDIYVTVMLPIESLESNITLFSNATLMISLLVLSIGLFFSFALSSSITNPIQRIEKTTARLSKLDFSFHVDENMNTLELAKLSKSINHMSTQLESAIGELAAANIALQEDVDHQKQLESMRREFIANVSHEMKTPLTLLQIYGENLKNEVDGIDKDYYCDTILEETNYLHKMVESMLSISSIESGLSRFANEAVYLSEVTAQMVERMRPLLVDVTLDVQIEDDMFLMGDETYITQAMKNYINNAISHTKEGDAIVITLVCDHAEKQVHGFAQGQAQQSFYVYNQGAPIPEKSLQRVWESFYKSDHSRVRVNTANAGLGLHIVKSIVDKHGGYCTVQNMPAGVRFGMHFPVVKELQYGDKTEADA